jgi:hypothetical protein
VFNRQIRKRHRSEVTDVVGLERLQRATKIVLVSGTASEDRDLVFDRGHPLSQVVDVDLIEWIHVIDELIEYRDLVSGIDQQLADVRTDEAGATR